MKLCAFTFLLLAGALALGLGAQQGLDPSQILAPPAGSWPTYNGDYSGRRFSPLAQINSSNVKSLGLAWTFRIDATPGNGARISATPLEISGVLYFTVPNRVWAIDARSGQLIWTFTWPSKIDAISNRGVAISGDTLFFETTDCNLVALHLDDGKEKWHASFCNVDQMYFGSAAPVVVKNHLILGVSGDDLDIPGYLESRDPETGELQWRWNAYPDPASPEAATWPDQDAMTHGGGMTWVPGTYDPQLNLYYFGTGNAQPVINGNARPGANLYTACIIALNPDTGKMAWYFQPNPHDTHDWDAVQTPVLIDGRIAGRDRKLLAQASRNGWFFLLDRATGQALVSKPFATQNWTSGVDAKGQPIPSPDKAPKVNGSLVAPNQAGGENWHPPSFDPATGLFYVDASDAYSLYYIFDDSAKPEGWAGNDRGGWSDMALEAIDYATGRVQWSHKWPSQGARSGILTTAGGLLFVGDPSSNLVAFNASTGAILWHAGLATSVSNGPIAYRLDGREFVLVAAGDTLYAFTVWDAR